MRWILSLKLLENLLYFLGMNKISNKKLWPPKFLGPYVNDSNRLQLGYLSSKHCPWQEHDMSKCDRKFYQVQ